MFRKKLGFAWKILPPRLRLAIIRATQQKFTVSAAAVILNESGEVLLLNHVLRPFSGWGLPGGFLSTGEQPEHAIRREIREETGIELKDLEMFRIRTLGRHVEMLFSAIAVGDPVVMSREILELGWFDIESMPEQMSGAQKSLIRERLRG
jgi:ADP-ribose pyrophosphatase YjhB (NUDIX family)